MTSSFVTVVLSLAYLVGFMIFLRRARSTGALVPMTLPPLLLMGFAAWIAHARVAQNIGIGPSSMWLLAFGAAVTAFCAALAIARVRDDAVSHRRPPVVVPAIAWLTAYAALAMPWVRLTGFAAWNVSLLGAFLSLALLVAVAVTAGVANRYAVSRGNQRTALGVTLGLAVVLAAAAWLT